MGDDAGPAEAMTVSCSPGLTQWLARHGASIAFTSHQPGRLFLAGVTKAGALSLQHRPLDRAMGLGGDADRLLVADRDRIWRLENVLAPGERAAGRFDRMLVPRVGYITGDVDIHELGIEACGRIVFVNTRYSCLATVSAVHGFRPLWRPAFVSRLAPQDRCHLNGLCLDEAGRARFVTAAAATDTAEGWRSHRGDGGVVIALDDDRVAADGLSMPHSPRLHGGALWVLDSGRGRLVRIDPAAGRAEDVAFCPGFMRGLSFHGGHAVIGLSLPRDRAFDGLALQGEIERRGESPWCGIQIVDLAHGDVVEWLRFDGGIRELFDVRLLPGAVCPTALPTDGPELAGFISMEAPSRPLDERGWP